MFGGLDSLQKGYKYCNDGNNISFPWFQCSEKPDSFVTIEGPTNKYSIVHVLVIVINYFKKISKLASKLLQVIQFNVF